MRIDENRFKIVSRLKDRMSLSSFMERGFVEAVEDLKVVSKNMVYENTVEFLNLYNTALLDVGQATLMTKPVAERMYKSKFLDDIETGLFALEGNHAGVILCPYALKSFVNAVGYFVINTEQAQKNKERVVLLGIYTNDGLIAFYSCLFKDSENDVTYKGVMSKSVKRDNLNELRINEIVRNAVNVGIGSMLFLEYVEHEIKIIDSTRSKKEKKVKVANDGVHSNETEIPVQVITSNYFTTTVRTEGFEVEGHWRWQRHGEKFSKVKRIWINDFKKEGYTRKATIEER